MQSEMSFVPFSLDRARPNTWAVIESVKGDAFFAGRAAARGFTPTAVVFIIQNYGVGPLIVFLRDTQIAMARAEAKKILVRSAHVNA